MAWTELTRRQHDRAGERYASDLTDAEWALIKPLMPPRRTTGRPRTTHLRDVFDAILYIATTGCQWRMLPNDFPPVSTVRSYFYAWRDDGVLDELNGKLVEAARLAEGRKAQPTAGIIPSCQHRLNFPQKCRSKIPHLHGSGDQPGSVICRSVFGFWRPSAAFRRRWRGDWGVGADMLGYEVGVST